MHAPEKRIEELIDNFLFDLKTVDINWDYKPVPERWSAKEVIGHLIDSAGNNLNRFVRCTYEQNFKSTYHQDRWVAAQHYHEAGIEDLLTLWRLLNMQICTVLRNYPPEMLQNTCDTGKTEVSLRTVEWLAFDYVDHLQHHLKQIIK